MVGNALVDMYTSCGGLTQAREIFSGFLVRDVSCLDTIITRNIQYGEDEETLNHLGSLQYESILPNMVTYYCILRVIQPLVKKIIMVGNALVDMYANCGGLTQAQEIFSEFVVRDVTYWNKIIIGNIQYGQDEEA